MKSGASVPGPSGRADEPGVAFCGVDNALARAALEKPGFDLVVEAGLGAGPQAFRSFSMHTFPASRPAEELWSRPVAATDDNFEDRPAYQALRHEGMDECGLAQLASRTVGVPFVGLIAAALAVSELLRRLHGGTALELASGSVAALQDVEAVSMAGRAIPGRLPWRLPLRQRMQLDPTARHGGLRPCLDSLRVRQGGVHQRIHSNRATAG